MRSPRSSGRTRALAVLLIYAVGLVLVAAFADASHGFAGGLVSATALVTAWGMFGMDVMVPPRSWSRAVSGRMLGAACVLSLLATVAPLLGAASERVGWQLLGVIPGLTVAAGAAWLAIGYEPSAESVHRVTGGPVVRSYLTAAVAVGLPVAAVSLLVIGSGTVRAIGIALLAVVLVFPLIRALIAARSRH